MRSFEGGFLICSTSCKAEGIRVLLPKGEAEEKEASFAKKESKGGGKMTPNKD